MEQEWPLVVRVLVVQVVARLEANVDELVALILAEIRRALPGYAELGDAEARLLEAGVRATVEMFTALLAAGRVLAPAELAALAQRGAERAAQGLSVDDMRRSVRVGIDVAWRFVGEAVGELTSGLADSSVGADAMCALGSWFFAVERAAVDAMVKGYLDWHDHAGSEEGRARRTFVAGMLDGALDAGEQDRLAAMTGCDPAARYGLLLLAPHRSTSQTTWRLARGRVALLALLPRALDGPIKADPSPHGVVVVPVEGAEDWRAAVRAASEAAPDHGLVILASAPDEGGESLAGRYAHAAGLIGVAALAAPEPTVLRPSDLDFHRIVRSMPPDVYDRTLRPAVERLVGEPEDDLREHMDLIRALCSTGHNRSSAARLLGVSESGVTVKKKKLAGVTGLDLEDPDDRVRLHLLLFCHELWQGRPQC